MPNDMTILLGGETIPYPTTFKRIIEPNETDNRTLGGTLYTDFINNRRSWIIGWKYLKEEDFNIIYDLYMAQYQNEEYHNLIFAHYDINCLVKMNISEQNIKYNGVLIENLTMILKEKLAFT